MNEQDFNNFLSWVFWLNSFAGFIGAIIFLLWIRIVERKISKAIFFTGAVGGIVVGLLRLATAYEVDNLSVRAIHAIIYLVSSFFFDFVFLWTYHIQHRERMKRTIAEQLLREKSANEFWHTTISETAESLCPKNVTVLINNLHPKDAAKLCKKYVLALPKL